MSGSAGDAPVLEGEHRLGEGMRRGVFCLGLVPVATGLTLREAMWMQCCLTAGVEPGPMPHGGCGRGGASAPRFALPRGHDDP